MTRDVRLRLRSNFEVGIGSELKNQLACRSVSHRHDRQLIWSSGSRALLPISVQHPVALDMNAGQDSDARPADMDSPDGVLVNHIVDAQPVLSHVGGPEWAPVRPQVNAALLLKCAPDANFVPQDNQRDEQQQHADANNIM